jgi:hypothetical protein
MAKAPREGTEGDGTRHGFSVTASLTTLFSQRVLLGLVKRPRETKRDAGEWKGAPRG